MGLDPRGIKAAYQAACDYLRIGLRSWLEGALEPAIAAYLREALRLRPMSEASPGAEILIYEWATDIATGEIVPACFIGSIADGYIVDQDGNDAYVSVDQAAGWLPLPRPTDDGERRT